MRRRPLLAALLLAALATACGPVVEVAPTAPADLAEPQQTSVVLDADGGVLAELHAEQDRELVSIDDIPQVLRDAVIAVEDARFELHAGVDARAVARAFLQNAREGRVTEGGSTITQQLAKNVATGDARTLRRKLEEASVALQLESQLSKDEILEHYLNTVYFGNGAYGVQTASRRYFGIDVAGLSLPQAALLAGLLQAPATYDPLSAPEAATARRDLVLDIMRRRGKIDAETAQEARAADLGLDPQRTSDGLRAPYFVAHVMDALQHDERFAALGDDPVERAHLLFRGGLEIETTLDSSWQEAAEDAVAATLTDPEDPRGAVVAIDPRTGGIRALVGGRDYFDADDPVARFNLATQAERQPGSTFKTVALAAALADGHALEDRYAAPASIELPADPPAEPASWTVTNYDDRDLGELSLREATVRSANTAYAQLVGEVGAERVAAMAHDLGVAAERDLRGYRSIALGSQEVTVLDMATVQATLAAGGIRREPSAVTRVTAADGTVLYDRGTPEGERVLDEGVAWLVSDALSDVVASGTGQRASLRRPLAGKTGTSQRSADAWFAGYTPDLAAAVWIGFAEGQVPMVPPTTRARVEGGTWPAELFARFGTRALEAVPTSDFPVPEAHLVHVTVDTRHDCLPTAYTPRHRVAERAYLAGSEPTEPCDEPDDVPQADVPDGTGAEEDEARRQLEGAGFRVRRRPQFSATLPPGIVLRQEPAPGPDQPLEQGYEATLWVSSADRTPTDVPDALGAPVDEAREALEAAGFVVEVEQGCPDGTDDCTGARQRPGAVWEQEPDVRERVPAHSLVILRAYPDGR